MICVEVKDSGSVLLCLSTFYFSVGAEFDDEVYGLLVLQFSFRTICGVELNTPEKTERQTPILTMGKVSYALS